MSLVYNSVCFHYFVGFGRIEVALKVLGAGLDKVIEVLQNNLKHFLLKSISPKRGI